MIGSTRTLRVWAYTAPADLRKGFDGLAGLVTAQLRQDPLGGGQRPFYPLDVGG
jgi:transposase